MSKPGLPSTITLLSMLAVASSPAPAQAPAPAPSPDQQVAALEASCAASAPERASRHAKTPLYKRLRGDEGILAITREVVRLHLQNPPIRHYFEKVDADAVARRVASFMASGTGGPKSYPGPDLTTSHRAMKLTNRDFVLAGGDVAQAMKNLEYGPQEIDEVVCTLVALRPQVVLGS
jgi:truncated hemoglobin YjbI